MRRTHLIADLVIETSEKWVGGELSFAEMALAHLADRLVREPRIATVDAPSRGLALGAYAGGLCLALGVKGGLQRARLLVYECLRWRGREADPGVLLGLGIAFPAVFKWPSNGFGAASKCGGLLGDVLVYVLACWNDHLREEGGDEASLMGNKLMAIVRGKAGGDQDTGAHVRAELLKKVCARLQEHGQDALDWSTDSACCLDLLASWGGWEYAKEDVLPSLWEIVTSGEPFQQGAAVRCIGSLGRCFHEAGQGEDSASIYDPLEQCMGKTEPGVPPMPLEVVAAAAQELLDIYFIRYHADLNSDKERDAKGGGLQEEGGILKRVTEWFAALSGAEQAATPGKLRGDLRTLLGAG